jgi:hypothetical protein
MMHRRAGDPLLALPRRLAADQLVEVAPLSARGLVLVQKGQAVLVKLVEPFIPGDVLK